MTDKAVSAPAAIPESVHAGDATESRDGVIVWLAVRAADKPRRMTFFLGELAGPDFDLEACRESARLGGGANGDYRAHWYCRFAPRARDNFAPVRLLKRLTGAGFNVLRYEAGAQTASLNSAA